MYKCLDCGNSDKFNGAVVVSVQATFDAFGRMHDYEQPNFKGCVIEPEECAECGSNNVVDLLQRELGLETPLSEHAKIIFDYMQKEYIKVGYHSSGSVFRSVIFSILNRDADAFIKELIEAKLIEVRNCKAPHIYQLTLPVRQELIKKYELDTVWELDKVGSAFYPNGQFGEVTRVMNDGVQQSH